MQNMFCIYMEHNAIVFENHIQIVRPSHLLTLLVMCQIVHVWFQCCNCECGATVSWPRVVLWIRVRRWPKWPCAVSGVGEGTRCTTAMLRTRRPSTSKVARTTGRADHMTGEVCWLTDVVGFEMVVLVDLMVIIWWESTQSDSKLSNFITSFAYWPVQTMTRRGWSL